MPNYEYKCTAENTKFEIWQEVGAGAPPCPTCGAPSKKVFGPTRTIFKGSGFYVTDLRAEKSAAKGGVKSEEKAEAAPVADAPAVVTKTETKSEKTEAKSASD